MADLPKDVGTTSIMVEKPPKTFETKAIKFVFTKCCFCVPLRIGCLILAYLYLAGAIFVGIYLTIEIRKIVKVILFIGTDRFLNTLLSLDAVFIALILVSLPFNILLLIGLHQERRKFVKIFVIFQLVNVILTVLHQIVTVGSFGYMVAAGFFIYLAIHAINIYYLFVTRNQYVKMGETINKLPSQVYRDGRIEIMP